MAEELTNGFDKTKSKAHIDACENIQGEIDAILAQAKKDCETHRDDLKQAKKDARTALNVGADIFNAALRQRKFERKAENVRAGLDEDNQETYDQFMFALGDLKGTPLGEAAQADIAKAA